MFYDKDSEQYIISWHACNDPDKDDWDSMRTLYVLTKDFETYTEPQKLFNFTGTDENMAIIDAIIRKVNGVYYAIMKDERDPAVAPETGKTVRIATSSNLTGPYTNPGAPVTPNDMMREAPILSNGRIIAVGLFMRNLMQPNLMGIICFSRPLWTGHGKNVLSPDLM